LFNASKSERKMNKTLKRLNKYRDVNRFSLENKKAILYKWPFLRIFLKTGYGVILSPELCVC
ncbi:hypothetical protein, partial [Proteus mirabilis]|uniref:hypothetical protein n=1 Tax=Proteus mirabilis TaxID=584 RepID=UPI001ADDA5AD